jgi:hypothetical protein
MINARLIWSKVKRDQALNMTELAHASGYDRGALRVMCLPWQGGKLSLSDFKRVLRMREDYREKRLRTVKVMLLPSPSASANGRQRQVAADRFYAPSSKRAGKAAARPVRSGPLHSSA